MTDPAPSTEGTNAGTSGRDAPSVQAARDLGRALADRSQEFEQLRRLPEDVSESLRELGVFRLWVPRRYGGFQLSLLDALSVLDELSYWDGALGWCAMIGATTASQAGFLPEQHARSIYGDPRVITGGTAEPRGRARRIDGGLEVTGQWAWGSGTFHCDWIGGGCLLPAAEAEERPRALFAYFERQQVELLDTWHVSGLKGTGSTDFKVVEAFVPAGRWVEIGVSQPQVSGALYRFPTLGLLALGVCSVALGIARRAIDELQDVAAGKRYVGSRRTLAQRPAVQADVARAEAELWSAWAFVEKVAEQAMQAAEEGALETEHRRRLRLAATHGVRSAVRVVDSMFQTAGGTAVYELSPLQRLSRDIHVAATHGMVAPRTFELYGRLALGLETDTAGL